MGDRYTLTIDCAYCLDMNEDVYYAPSSGIETFKCESCGKMNKIVESFKAEKT
jgi:hypothetical protein